MPLVIEAYEDWGAPVVVAGPPSTTAGTTRTKITNANLKTFVNPAQHYYLNDVPRPVAGITGSEQHICSFTRWISFKITGTFVKIKNVRIEIPSGFASDNWRVNYGLRSTYVQPAGITNQFSKSSGAYDGTLNSLTESVTLYPLLSTVGPEAASSIPDWHGPNATVWTQYLVLQFMAHPSTFSDVDNFGTDTITLVVDELEL